MATINFTPSQRRAALNRQLQGALAAQERRRRQGSFRPNQRLSPTERQASERISEALGGAQTSLRESDDLRQQAEDVLNRPRVGGGQGQEILTGTGPARDLLGQARERAQDARSSLDSLGAPRSSSPLSTANQGLNAVTGQIDRRSDDLAHKGAIARNITAAVRPNDPNIQGLNAAVFSNTRRRRRGEDSSRIALGLLGQQNNRRIL